MNTLLTPPFTSINNDYQLFENDPYFKVYGEKYKQQIERLRWHIEEGETGINQFIVLDIEAGLGKSVKTNKILLNHLNGWGKRNFLIVKRFKSDVEECVEDLRKSTLGKYSVFGITSDDKGTWKSSIHKIKEYRVLVITHSRYIDLCMDEGLRNALTEGRHTIIIDEKIDFPIYSFSSKIYKEIWLLLPYQLHSDYEKVCSPLLRLIEKIKLTEDINNKVVRCEPGIHPKTLSNFIRLVKANQQNIINVLEVNRFINALLAVYNNQCFYNGERISSINPKHKLWGLQNNIILDANGSIDHSYKIAEKVMIDKQDKIVNHCDSQIYWIKCNTSKTSVSDYQHEFFEEISAAISEFYVDGERTLIVTHKDFEKVLIKALEKKEIKSVGVGDDYVDEDVAINHVGNLIGRNTYRDFHQCWIIATPNIPMEAHVLKWMQYSENSIGKKRLKMSGKNDAYRFNDKELEQMRMSYIIGELYQCAKRVQRNVCPKAEFFIFTKAEDIFDGLVQQLQNVEIGENTELELKPPREKSKTKKTDKVDEIVDNIKHLIKGVYKKKDIFSNFGITSNYNRYLQDIRVTNLVKAGLIKINHHTIEVL